MSDLKQTIGATLVACGVFLAMFLGLKWELIPSAVFGVSTYAGVYLLPKPRRRIGGKDVELLQGGEEFHQLLEEAGKDLHTIKKAASAVKDPQVKQNTERLYETGNRIMSYLKQHPEKISAARRFFTYYLDTAAALADRYVQFQATGLHTEEVEGILQRTAKALPMLDRTFENQFTRLMEGELMDVEAEIALLENTLKMEGGQ